MRMCPEAKNTRQSRDRGGLGGDGRPRQAPTYLELDVKCREPIIIVQNPDARLGIRVLQQAEGVVRVEPHPHF